MTQIVGFPHWLLAICPTLSPDPAKSEFGSRGLRHKSWTCHFTNLSDQIELGMHGLKSAQRILHPSKEFTAFFVELVYPGASKFPFKFTTEVSVVPDVLPYRFADAAKKYPLSGDRSRQIIDRHRRFYSSRGWRIPVVCLGSLNSASPTILKSRTQERRARPIVTALNSITIGSELNARGLGCNQV
jgi:hypothetical protein